MQIAEKRIFGVLTADQVGYVPNIKVNFTENSEKFCQDTYKFQSMMPDGFVHVDIGREYRLEKVVNEYEPQ